VFIVLVLLLTAFAGLVSAALLLGAIYVLWAWYMGELLAEAWLAAAGAALLWSLLGRHVVLMFHRKGKDDPQRHGAGDFFPGAHGSTLHVEAEGPTDAPTLVLTHGWGFDASAWCHIRRQLPASFRLLLWDLPGMGASTSFGDGVYQIERFAENLHLLTLRAQGPVVLVGHSIGGMTMLTFCRRYPALLGSKVKGLILIDTTFTMPLRTTAGAHLLPQLQKPIAKAILHVNRLLWPAVWLMNWQSYLNGTSHLVTRLVSFSRDVTRGELDFAARFTTTQHPGVVAKGILATLDWDESATLEGIPVPTTVIVGKEDRLTVPQASHYIASTVPDGKLSEITPAGHSGIVEESDAYAAAIAVGAARAFDAAIRNPEAGRPTVERVVLEREVYRLTQLIAAGSSALQTGSASEEERTSLQRAVELRADVLQRLEKS
jgi:pimeloyl-ACP methyl ester carboxylesterase